MTPSTKHSSAVTPTITLQMSLLGSGRRPGREDLLLGGKLLVKSPHGLKPLDRLLLENSAELPATHIMSVALDNPIPALALAALHPEAQVTYYHYDLFHVRQAETLADGHRLTNVQCLCAADVPRLEQQPELVLTGFRTDDEVGLTLEVIRQAHAQMAYGGKLLSTINNLKDQWLRHQLEKTFGNLSLLAKDKHGLLYSVKRKDKPQGEEAPAEALRFIKHVPVSFGELQFEFETCYGTFSSDGLDDGSRALLEMMEAPESCNSILDLGCGWGAMGIIAARKTGAERVVMIDANARAVDMAKRNVEKQGLSDAEVRLEADVELMQNAAETGRFDLVISNPPYWTEFRVADLFIQMAWRALRPGGKVLLVGKNNPLMVTRTEEQFGNVEVLRRRGYSIVVGVKQDTRRY